MALYDPHIQHHSSTDGYWLAQGTNPGTVINSDATPANTACLALTAHYSRVVPAGLREDLCAMTFHIAKGTGSTRTVPALTDATTLEPIVDTFITTLNSLQSNQFKCVDYVWHYLEATVPKAGPAIRTVVKAFSGSVASGRMPDQDACTLTFHTPARRQWGRIYIPGLSNAQYETTYGRFTNSNCDSIALAGNAMATSLYTAGFTLGVFSKVGAAFLDVSGIACDNIVDIQRRRRAKQRSYIKTYGL